MYRIIRTLLFLTIFLAPALCVFAVTPADSTRTLDIMESGIKLSAQVDKTSVPLNRTLVLTIRVEWSGNLDRYQPSLFENPIINNLEIIANSSANKVSVENGINIAKQEFTFTLKPQSLGMGYIEGFIIKYRDMAVNTDFPLTTNRIEIKVIDPVPEPGETPWALILGIVIFLAAAGAGFYYFIKIKRKNREQNEAEAVIELPLEEKMLAELKENINPDSYNLDVREGFTAIAKILKKFLNAKFELTSEGVTTDDYVNALSEKQVNLRFITDISDILRTLDIARFSGTNVNKEELERIYGLVEANLLKSLRGEIDINLTEKEKEKEKE